MPEKLYFNWSTGKDSALALYYILKSQEFQVDHLLTSINAHHDRVSMHGLRRQLYQQQMDAIGLTCSTIELPEQPDMAIYEEEMNKALSPLIEAGYRHTAFGDIFLEDLRKYREDKLSPLGIRAHFPLWHKNTHELLDQFFSLGFRAIVICANATLLDESFVGCELTPDWVSRLPEKVDPCGENGEFHTFCFDGPVFQKPVDFIIGERQYREYDTSSSNDGKMGFWFCDLLPV